MKLQHLILALLFALAAAASIYVRHNTPGPVAFGEALCLHSIATGHVVYARYCI